MFRFKQFVMKQDKCGMKISSAACIFASLIEIEKDHKNILDIGTGTGLIALMLAQKFDIEIDAIEIDKEAALQARENFEESPWTSRLKVVDANVVEWAFEQHKKYDIIVSNPPFFRASALSDNAKRALARHEQELDVPTLAAIADRLLLENGAVWLLIAAESYLHYGQIFREKGFFLQKEIALWDSPDAVKNFCYILVFVKKEENLQTEVLYIKNAKNGDYSPQYKALMKDFLIIF